MPVAFPAMGASFSRPSLPFAGAQRARAAGARPVIPTRFSVPPPADDIAPGAGWRADASKTPRQSAGTRAVAGLALLLHFSPPMATHESTASEPVLVTCRACGARNRIRPDAAQEKIARGAAPVCGRCKTPLPAPAPAAAGPVVVTDATFAAEVEQAPVPVLVDAWAPWCGPCKMLSPVVDELATELAGRVRVAKLNVDENPATAARFGIRGIPTLLVLRDGREVDRMVGVLPKAEIARRLDRAIR